MTANAHSRVIAIDPGSRKAGFAIIDYAASRSKIVSSGSILMKEKDPIATRLLQFFEDLQSLILKYHPDELALERIFFSKNAQSALTLGQARGVALLCAAQHNLRLFEYSPTEVKSAICGTGRADKVQVDHMVRVLAKLPASYDFSSPDHSDALAIGLTHAHTAASRALI